MIYHVFRTENYIQCCNRFFVWWTSHIFLYISLAWFLNYWVQFCVRETLLTSFLILLIFPFLIWFKLSISKWLKYLKKKKCLSYLILLLNDVHWDEDDFIFLFLQWFVWAFGQRCTITQYILREVKTKWSVVFMYFFVLHRDYLRITFFF